MNINDLNNGPFLPIQSINNEMQIKNKFEEKLDKLGLDLSRESIKNLIVEIREKHSNPLHAAEYWNSTKVHSISIFHTHIQVFTISTLFATCLANHKTNCDQCCQRCSH